MVGFKHCAGENCSILLDPNHRLSGKTTPQTFCRECRRKGVLKRASKKGKADG